MFNRQPLVYPRPAASASAEIPCVWQCVAHDLHHHFVRLRFSRRMPLFNASACLSGHVVACLSRLASSSVAVQRPTLRPAQPHGGVFLVCRTAGAGGWDVAAVDSFLCRAHQHGLNASLRPAECRCTHGAARISSSRIMSTRPGSALRSRPFRAGWLMVACGKSKRLRLTVRTDPTDRTGAVNSARGASCRLLGAAAPRAAEARPAAGGEAPGGRATCIRLETGR